MREEFTPAAILRVLRDHDVEFVVIGGLAGITHGSAYPTFDVDLVYNHDRANLERLTVALRDLDARLSGKDVPPDLPFQMDAESLRRGANFTFDTRLGRLDVLAEPQGAPTYEQLREEAHDAEIDGVPVKVASLDHLIAMKRAANRPKDQLMVTEYIALADELKRRGERD